MKPVVIFLLLLISGCKPSSVNPPGDSSEFFTIAGKVTDWALGDSVTALACRSLDITGHGDSLYVFGSCQIRSNGEFFIVLSAPPPQLLGAYIVRDFVFGDTAKFIIFSALELRHPDGQFESKSLHNDSEPYAVFTSDSAEIGEYYAYFEFSDRDVNMVGTRRGVQGSAAHYDTLVTQYDLHYKKGWNRIVNVLESRGAKIRFEQRRVENVNSGNWYLEW